MNLQTSAIHDILHYGKQPKKKDSSPLVPAEDIWSLIQLASHPHQLSLCNIINQLLIQKNAGSSFVIEKPYIPFIISENTRDGETCINKVSVVSLDTMFELLRHVKNANPEVLSNVLLTTATAIENLPQKSFVDDNLNSMLWSQFLEGICKDSADKNAFNTLLTTAILQNRLDTILSAIKLTLSSNITSAKVNKVFRDVRNRSLLRYKSDNKHLNNFNWWDISNSDPAVTVPIQVKNNSDSLNFTSEGIYLYVYNDGELSKYCTGIGGTIMGKLLKKIKIMAASLMLLSVSNELLYAIKTSKSRALVAINTTSLTIEKLLRIDIKENSKYYIRDGRLVQLTGTWSNCNIIEYDLHVEDYPVVSRKHLTVTNPSLFAFGSSLCDNEKQCHNIISEETTQITGTDAFSLAIGKENRLLFKGNSDEIGTGQGLIDKWIELSVGGITKFNAVAAPHQEQYAVMISDAGKPYIAGHFKKGVDGDSSKPKKKPSASKPKLVDRIKEKVVSCAAGDSTSAFVTECGQLYMFGNLASPFDSNGLVPQFSVLSVKSVELGHNHAVILTNAGQVYTMGSNSMAQCGRNYIPNPNTNPEEEESDSDDGMCDPGTHVWRSILCMICFFCGECTGYGPGCCRNGEPGRDPGLECGCGAGDSGCSICGCCKTCAKEAQLMAKKNPKFKPKNEPKPIRFVTNSESDEESRESSMSDHPSEDSDDEDDDREADSGTPSKKHGENGELKPMNPAELTKLPAPIKLNASALQIACGLHHSVVLLATGEVWGFGANTSGQLGMGSVAVLTVPTKLSNLPLPAQQVACGSTHTVVLANEEVYTSGKYMDGQLGRCPSDFCKDLKRTDSGSTNGLASKGWYSVMSKVPGFGPDSSRHVVDISAVGNRTFVKCRKSILGAEIKIDDPIEVLIDDDRFVVTTSNHENNKKVLVEEEPKKWKQKELPVKANCKTVFDDRFKTFWIFDPATNEIHGYEPYNNTFVNRAHPLVLTESILPHDDTYIDKDALCYGLLSHLTILSNPISSPNSQLDTNSKEDKMLLCNRFPSFGGGWGYSGKSLDAILFATEQDILLYGIGVYGGRGNYTAKIKIYEIGYGGPEPDDGDLIFELPSVNYTCKPKAIYQVMFDEPISIINGTWYRVVLKVEGPSSDCGNSGKREVMAEGIKFIFRSSKRSTNGTDYGSGQIPQLIFKKCEKKEQDDQKASVHSDILPLGDWNAGLNNLLAILKLGFNLLHKNMKTSAFSPSKNRKFYLNLTKSEAQVNTVDPVQKNLESKVCISIGLLDTYLAVARHTPVSLEKDRALRDCQDILSSILKLPIVPESKLILKCSEVYSKHFHLFYPTPQHCWSLFFSVYHAYKKHDEAFRNLLSTVLDAMSNQGDIITHEMYHYGSLLSLINPTPSAMSLGSEITDCSSTELNVDLDQLNNVTYKKALSDVINLSMSDNSVGASSRKVIKVILEQIVLATVEYLSDRNNNKETCSRFSSVSLKSWNTKGKVSPDAITFTVSNSNIFLSGIGLFQATRDSSCDIEVLLKDVNEKWKSIYNHSGQLKKVAAVSHINKIYFKSPIKLKPDTPYTIKVHQYGGSVVHGKSKNSITTVIGPDGIVFTFYECPLSLSGTDLTQGQIPFLIYRTQLNQEIEEVSNNEKSEQITLQLMELLSSAFIKYVDRINLNGTFEVGDAISDFLIQTISYAQIILLNKNTPKSSFLLLENVLKPLLASLSEANHKEKRADKNVNALSDSTETVIVESEHPYSEATVLHYQAALSSKVNWMVVEFSPESGVGPEDSLQLFIPNPSYTYKQGTYTPIQDNIDGKLKPVLKLGGAAIDWPKRCLLLPGNKLSFILKSITKVNKQQMNDSDWGFCCKVTGYTSSLDTKIQSLEHLEHVIADVAGACVRVMISPTNTSLRNISQEGHYAFKAHAKLLSRGLYLNSLPSYVSLRKRSFLEEEPNELTFLNGFIAASKITSGGRLALWLDPTEVVEITKAHIEIGIYDGEDCHYTDTIYPVICCLQNSDEEVVFPLGAKINISLVKLDVDKEEGKAMDTEPMPADTCFEENRYGISKNLRLPTVVDAKSYNNGFYSITWQPRDPGRYELTVIVDGTPCGETARAVVADRKKPRCKTKRSEMLLDEYKKKRKVNKDFISFYDGPANYEVIKCGSGGHTLRGNMSCSSSPVGKIALKQVVEILKTQQTSEGIWGLLSETSKNMYCSSDIKGYVYVLICSPFNTFLTLTSAGTSDPKEVFILKSISKSENIPETVVFDHGTEPPKGDGDGGVTAATKSDYTIAFTSDETLTEDIDVKCVNSKTLTTTIRTVFAAYLWHYGAVHDAMAAAAYIKFEHSDSPGDDEQRELKRHRSTPSQRKAKPGAVQGLSRPDDRKKRTSSYTLQKTESLSEGSTTESIVPEADMSSLKMLCTLWDSVKELVMTCATTKIKPPPTINEPDSNNKDNQRPKKKRSKKSLKSDEETEQCELCSKIVPHPVTYHMSEKHPGCGSTCGGMGYNSKGIYCSGWSGLCGEGGKGLSMWYLLCVECCETYKQEPLPASLGTPPTITFQVDAAASGARKTDSKSHVIANTISTNDLEEQLSNIYNNARFLLTLAPLVENSPPESTDYETFMEEAMEVELGRNKFRSLQQVDNIAACLSPMTPMSPGILRTPTVGNSNRSSNKVVRSLSVNVENSKTEPKDHNILYNPSAQLVKLATVISLDRGQLFGFMSQKQPLFDLEEELIRGVEKAWSISKGLLAADWLLRSVSTLPVLHSVLWRLYMGLLSDPNNTTSKQKEGLLPRCQHPITSSIKCYDMCVSRAFRTVMQSLADLLPRLPPGSDIQKVAISCWNLEFRPEDHKFLQDSQVFSHIHRLLTSASRRDVPVDTPQFQQSEEIGVEVAVSSRDVLIPYLTDKKTDTFWESGDKDNWISLKIPPDATCHALALYLNNDEDRGFVTNKVTIKVGNVPKVLKQLTYTDVGLRYCGWLWYEISGYCQIELHFTAKKDHVRVRQLIVYGGIANVSPTSHVPSSQDYALQVFRVLTNDILRNITADESDGSYTSADLHEHLVSILFEQSHLTATQNKVLLHVVNAIKKQALAITDKTAFNDDYCFELLSLVSALSGSSKGCFNLVVHDTLIKDIFKLLHLGTKRIQRQVILLLRRILTQISPEKLCAITETRIPLPPYGEYAENQRTVLNNLLAYVMKSIKLITKSKNKKNIEEYTKMNIEHTDYWVQGTVDQSLAQEVVILLKDMAQGKMGADWKGATSACLSYLVFSLTHIPEESRTEEKLAKNRWLWLALASLSIMDEELMTSLTIQNQTDSKEYCENHDDGRTKAIISCSKCGYLCAECDKYLHLSKKSKAHQRQLFKAAEASLVLIKHENMCRVKLYWLMCVVDTQSSKAVIEFRNTYGSHAPDSLVCRFCNDVGEPHPEGGIVCKNDDCLDKFKKSCKKILGCGHPCYGNVGEMECLPCLKNCNEDIRQDADDMCVICFTESLGCGPCLQLKCGHILHTECTAGVITAGWYGPRITFNFIGCPICKKVMSHPHLNGILEPLLVLKSDVESKSVMRLKYDGISFDTVEESVEYAINKYAYYQCYLCKKAYFGGEAQCQAAAGDEFNPEDLVCGGCSNISQEVCPKHGSDYLEYKCRYCCSVAVFFCFGSTHFCTPCHDDFVRLRSLKKDTLPQCPVGPKAVQLDGVCPLGVEHPPTGEEFALGCGVCRNMQTF